MLLFYTVEESPPMIELKSGIQLEKKVPNIKRRLLEEKSPSAILNLIQSRPLLLALDLKMEGLYESPLATKVLFKESQVSLRR